MDERLLRHYNRELQYLREMGQEFAHDFPKIAGRLGMEGMEVADPYVERLMEGFAFLAARVQLKIESEFPRFTQHIFEKTYPQYLCPLPSMSIVRFEPNLSEGDLGEGPVVPRGSVIKGLTGSHLQTNCKFTTAHEVALWPLEIVEAQYHTRDLPSLDLGHIPGARAAIRLRLRATAGLTFAELPLDRLVLHVCGASGIAARIYEQLMARVMGVALHAVARPPKWVEFIGADSVREYGFEDEQALLPNVSPSFQGYRLMQEYFALPQRFHFIELNDLLPGIRRCEESEIDITIVLFDADIELDGMLNASNFSLFCTPAANLFEHRLDRIHLKDADSEYHLVPERTAPLDYEVHSIKEVAGFGAPGQSDEIPFESFYQARDKRNDAETGFFAVNRVPRTLSQKEQQGIRRSTRYTGSESYISLVDVGGSPFRTGMTQLGITAMCTNRDLPLHLPVGQGPTDFTLELGLPVQAIRCLNPPTQPLASHAEGDHAWRLLSHLTPHYLSIIDTEEGEAGDALRELLGLYGDLGKPEIRRQIEGVRAVSSRSVLRRVQQGGPIAFARGMEITVTMDELAFEGTGIYLLGAVLNRFFARFVTINVFTETVLRSLQRGEVRKWPVMTGRQKNI